MAYLLPGRIVVFDKYFEVFLTDTEEAQGIHYGIRYQVAAMSSL